jgi:hypothetical protein
VLLLLPCSYSDTSKKLAELTAAAAKLQATEDAENVGNSGSSSSSSAVTASGIKKKTIESFVLAVDDLKVAC